MARPEDSASSPFAWKDRSAGLVVFGIFEIIAGALCTLLVPLIFVGQAMSSKMTGEEPQYRLVIPAALVYGLMAAAFITLGIGSIRARRWARAFCLILGWSWLVMGSIAVVVYAFVVPKILFAAPPGGGPRISDSAKLAIVVVAIALMTVICVLFPLAVVLFYKSPHVRATVESRDPIVRWTDRRPLPVLALSLWLAAGGVFMLLMPVAYHGVAPFFGVLISGLAGGLFYLATALIFLYLARAIYQQSRTAWWLVMALLALFAVSNVLTFAQVDFLEMYRLMGYSQAQIRQMQTFNVLQNRFIVFSSALGLLPMFGYLLYVRKYFHGPPSGSV